MSNIFDLFGTNGSNSSGHQLKRTTSESMVTAMKSRTLSDNGNMALKNSMIISGTKPKGLSLRQQTDPNISNGNSKQITDKNNLLKPTLKISSSNSSTITSRTNKDKITKLQTIRQRQLKGLTPSTQSPHSKFSIQKSPDEFKFKRPLVPRQSPKSTIIYPVPEKLSNYCDQKKLDRISSDNLLLDKGFNNLIISRKCVTPFEDEGFISDPELLNVQSLSPINFFDATFDNCIEMAMEIPEIPILSDDDEF